MSDKAKLQAIFDRVAAALLEQNEKSVSVVGGNTYCRYRGDGGLKCAAGHLIPDDLYDAGFELDGFAQLPEFVLEACGVGEDEKAVDLVLNLQSVHDSFTPRDWRSRLRQVANTFCLSAEVLDKL